MKDAYKGHEITVTREYSMADHEMVFYSIFRMSDWYECTSGYDESEETLEDFIEQLKVRIDQELKTSDPWGENGPPNLNMKTEIEFFVDGDFKIKEP